jgi:hypothetical protein
LGTGDDDPILLTDGLEFVADESLEVVEDGRGGYLGGQGKTAEEGDYDDLASDGGVIEDVGHRSFSFRTKTESIPRLPVMNRPFSPCAWA